MDQLIGEAIEVERAPDSPRPVRFQWHGEVHEVTQVLREWVDVGHGELPRRSRRWYTRRHRLYFDLRDAANDRFVLYLDYSNRARPVWFLVKKVAEAPSQG